MERRARHAARRGREGKTPAPRGSVARARHRPGRSGVARHRGDFARAQRHQGSAAAGRQVSISRAHGRRTDGQGRTVDFKNTVIIMTSNIGSRFLLERVHGDAIPDSVRESVMAELRKSFRPEFLNRIDETILFKPLTLEEITSIVDLLLVDLNKRPADRQITVKLDAKAKEWVAEKGYDPAFGARPLKRYLQRNLETKLTRAL